MEVLIAAAIMGGVAVVLLQIMKDQAKSKAKSDIELAIGQAQTEIVNLINTPAHCNANFATLATIAPPPAPLPNPLPSLPTISPAVAPALKTCLNPNVSGACRTGATGATTVSKFPVYHTSWGANQWEPSMTKISGRVRITSLRYEVYTGPTMTPPPATGTGTGYGSLQNLKLHVTYEINNENLKEIATTRSITKVYNTSVIVNGSSVVGCPRSINSTVPY